MRVRSCPNLRPIHATDDMSSPASRSPREILSPRPFPTRPEPLKRRAMSQPVIGSKRSPVIEELISFGHSVAISGLVSGVGTLFCFGVLGIPPLAPAALTFFACGAVIGHTYPKILNAWKLRQETLNVR